MFIPRLRGIATLCGAALLFFTAPASAQSDPRFAADRFEPSERGSEWFANESLNLAGAMPFRAGVVSSYGERLFVARDADGKSIASPLRNDEVLHVGASATPLSFLRLGVNLPLHLLTSGRSALGFRSPDQEQGVGDLRVGADVRVYGQDRGPLRLAMGAQLWAPTGEQEQWASDDAWRVRPRVMVAGEQGRWLWSAQLGVNFRDPRVGTDLGLSGAVGARLFDAKGALGTLVVGPELFTSTNLTQGAFERASTPFELMIGGHWLIAHVVRIGAGIGRGFTKAATDPSYRVLGMIEYSPEYRPEPPPPRPPPAPPPPPPEIPDTDHDGVKDDHDACPAVAGIPATDPAQNGCPPDTDGDGINDLGDACPTQPGPATDDPATTGCPAPAP